MLTEMAAHVFVSGRVQGVGFRNFTREQALQLQLRGYTRNLSDGRVEIEVEGERETIERLIQNLWQGPPRSNVTDVEVTWREPVSLFDQFSVLF